jgi:hypothetical protein
MAWCLVKHRDTFTFYGLFIEQLVVVDMIRKLPDFMKPEVHLNRKRSTVSLQRSS